MNPLTASKDVAEALGRLMDENEELAIAARDAEESVDARVNYLREVLDPDDPEVDRHVGHYNHIIRRMRVLAATRQRAAEGLCEPDAKTDALLKFLRAALQEGAYLASLDEDYHNDLPNDTLNRYAALFQSITGRPFERSIEPRM